MLHMKINRFLITFGSVLLTMILVSCSMFTPDNRNFYGGKILDNNAMEELRQEFEESNSTIQTESQLQIESTPHQNQDFSDSNSQDPSESETVYWSKSGSVWHLYSDCRYLKKSNEIFSGSVDQAKANGAEKICSACAKKEET